MRFMNEYDVTRAQQDHAGHPVLGPATETLANLVAWTDANSDGWPYWSKPARAAARLMELITGDGTWQAARNVDQRATPAAYRKALAPIKAFRTRHGADFDIVDSVPDRLDYLRRELRAGRASYGDLAELQELSGDACPSSDYEAPHIPDGGACAECGADLR